MVSLVKTLTEERTIALGQGVTVRIRPVGYARFNRLNAEALMRAARELAAEGEEAAPPAAVAQLSQAYLDRRLIVESVTGWEGVDDGEGNVPPVTEETWALFADLYPELATVAVAEIRRPGLLASAEGNGSAPSPNGAAAGAPSTAGTAAPSPASPSTPAPATAGRATAQKTSTGRPPRKAATSPRQ